MSVSVMAMQQEDRNRAERKLHAAARAAGRHLPLGLPPVIYLTDPARTPDPVATMAALPSSWAVIYRHFGQPERNHIASRANSDATRRHHPFLIAGDPQLAADVGADGVHWPFARVAEARRWRGRFALMTASAHSPDQLRSLQDAGIDAALLSTAFASASPSARNPLGPTRFRQLARASRLPVYALGGVGADTARAIAPVAGIAGIEGIESLYGPRI
ncbi:MAG: thiamine phosphate synthase [Hyphomonas sp.]|nr:thiamine phosphate synthase [Hyphomonas sp.]